MCCVSSGSAPLHNIIFPAEYCLEGMGRVAVARGEALFRYSFPEPHPLNKLRLERFYEMLDRENLGDRVVFIEPEISTPEDIMLFHTKDYVEFVQEKSQKGYGYLDYGDTPAFPGCYEASAYVVGTTLSLLKLILEGVYKTGFNPMGGLHHARRDRAGGFCIFNDAAIAIEYLLKKRGLKFVAYVDIDAHHGDGVCYDFYSDERVIFADIHQDGRTLYPGQGSGMKQVRGRPVDTNSTSPYSPTPETKNS